MTIAAATRPTRRALVTGALAFLLPVALGTGAGAQTQQPWAAGHASPQQVPPVVRRNPTPIAPSFDVRQMEALAASLVEGQKVPGLAMAIVHNGQVLSARGYGITDTATAQPVDAHTVFRLASLSKAFAGTLAGMLVHEGSLRWDSRVSQYMPSFKLSDPSAAGTVTVADVLTHRVGLSRNAFDRDLEAYVDYTTLVRRMADAPLKCAPGTCYSYQNVAFSLIGDVVFGATGNFYGQEVHRRIFKPLGMHDASVGLEGIRMSPSWARPHVHGRGGWVSVMPKTTYYQVLPAAGVNASASDMAKWLMAQTGYRPDVLPEPLLATLHRPLVDTPGETRSSSWRRERLNSAGYGMGWRVYEYAGSDVVFHGGAVQGYRGAVALLPGHDFGVAIMWNAESSAPTSMIPTILDRALGIHDRRWMKEDFAQPSLFVHHQDGADEDEGPGSTATKSTAAPY